MYTYAYACIYVYTYIYICRHIFAYICVYMQTCMHMYTFMHLSFSLSSLSIHICIQSLRAFRRAKSRPTVRILVTTSIWPVTWTCHRSFCFGYMHMYMYMYMYEFIKGVALALVRRAQHRLVALTCALDAQPKLITSMEAITCVTCVSICKARADAYVYVYINEYIYIYICCF